jgi:hypothetical protein
MRFAHMQHWLADTCTQHHDDTSNSTMKACCTALSALVRCKTCQNMPYQTSGNGFACTLDLLVVACRSRWQIGTMEDSGVWLLNPTTPSTWYWCEYSTHPSVFLLHTPCCATVQVYQSMLHMQPYTLNHKTCAARIAQLQMTVCNTYALWEFIIG